MFQKNSSIKIFQGKSGGRVSRLFLKIVGSRNTESFGRGTILCFRNSRVSNNFMPKSGNQPLPEETLLCPGTKKLRRPTFLCIHKNSGIEKKSWIRWGEGKIITIFPKKSFCLSVSKLFSGITFSVSNFLGSENFMRTRETSQFCVENLLKHSTAKLRRATFLCLTKFLVSKKFME